MNVVELLEETATETKSTETKPSNLGKTTGLKFIQGFGYSFTHFSDRESCKKFMLEEYPGKKESIEKWLDWYKGYYNMGKIKGFNQDKSDNITWKK